MTVGGGMVAIPPPGMVIGLCNRVVLVFVF